MAPDRSMSAGMSLDAFCEKLLADALALERQVAAMWGRPVQPSLRVVEGGGRGSRSSRLRPLLAVVRESEGGE